MTPEEWRRVKAIAIEALEQPEARRTALVAARCDLDGSLRREVESLLASTANAAHLYEPPAFAPEAVLTVLEDVEASGSLVGRRIGAYLVVAELGRGGMGVAYLGERADDAFEKRVAIKVIKRGMDTDAILRRFRHERRILANLDHPNIATLLDGGSTDDGLPYFIMEYVDGVPIDAFCDTHRLSISERLKLFQSVCAAVSHAHDNRVIHRDLKPGNIVVTSGGIPKLLDFGVATVLNPEQGLQTTDGTLLAQAMTPQYASPEQIRGQALTASSDVYSLGVLLYLLLTGRHPYRFDGCTPLEAARVVCEVTPRRPSASVDAEASQSRGEPPERLRRRLSGSLDTVTLTALSKDPERRYPSVKAFADDIQRCLDGLPVAARANRKTLFEWRSLRSRSRLLVGASLSAVVLVGAAIALTNRYGGSTPAAEGVESVAILPLSNTSGDPEAEYLSDGITENVITRLLRVPRLKVIARDSVYRYKGQAVDPQQVGRRLGVQAVLTGALELRGDAFSLDAQLIGVPDGRRLWREHYDRPLSDLPLLQAELAQEIAKGLRLRISPEERTRFSQNDTHSPEAYSLYLKGRYFWNRRTTTDLRKSIGYFRQAVERDPLFALAYAGLADAHGLLTEYHASPAHETYLEAKDAAERALSIDPDLAEAHASLAYVKQFYEWDWAGAEAEFKRAIELNPNYATGHQWYAEYLSAMGRHAEALAEIRRALDIDPISLIINSVEANLLYMARRYDEAIQKSYSVIDMDPNFPEAYEYLKRSYDQTRDYGQAIAARQKRRALLGLDTRMTGALRAAASTTSSRVYWRSRLEQELEEGNTEGLQAFEMAELHAQSGDTDGSLDWLEKACADDDFMIMYIKVAPNLDSLRSEPRFKALIAGSCRVQ